MADLWVLVPSRGRPDKVDRLVRACALTCTADTRLHFAFDEDDPAREASIRAAAGHRYTVGARNHLAGWTNDLACRHLKDSAALASVGDDMVPETSGWDRALLDALPPGGGAAYGHSNRRDDIPEHIVISTPLVAGLGRMALFGTHWFIDEAWRDVFSANGCLVLVPDVTIRHNHPNVPGGDTPDRTYHDAAVKFDADLAAYQRWRLSGMRRDIAAVARVRADSGAGDHRPPGDPAAVGAVPAADPAH